MLFKKPKSARTYVSIYKTPVPGVYAIVKAASFDQDNDLDFLMALKREARKLSEK